jgi:hypothetical protein
MYPTRYITRQLCRITQELYKIARLAFASPQQRNPRYPLRGATGSRQVKGNPPNPADGVS